ncbi:beta-N-acetylhexosaminidase [Cellvibrio fibrivorans]|uniref:beta-N-acetylhexosaminidase n=1 Tax=Cellvibrio fibrivorans TaxID=126350 RepID=A0ABU1UT00_9GAMM|nr:family 20 glycosylhydrolase [Cellvibrio fibrivorans]MDR7088307.1 hexosaminidase [Cellvibrio fibrivorans]
MTKYLLLVTCLFCSVWVNAQMEQLLLMPYPQKVERTQGQLVLGETVGFAVEGKKSAATTALVKILGKRIQQQTGQSLRLKNTSYSNAQLLIRVEDAQPISNYIADWDESYQLNITAAKIELTAKQLVGAQRGLETLLQLIGTDQKISLPVVSISDHPRFKWRGLLLDTSRHFFSVATIKRQIDAMAAAKYNIFHWHLTDDQGWRLESKKYPKLHKLASDGEYYTRKQIRDVVAYARARGIQVLPEIDMPGHASAIAVAYPELMSAPGPYAMEYRWGVHKPTLNPANEKVYEFADAIIAEVTELFPFEYVHIGGDEVDPEHWNTNPDIQSFMKAQGLKDHRALQAYFNQRLQKVLQKYQRKMIGWDEIQHKDLPKNIVIHSWRGPDGVSDAVSHGFQSILSTGYYLDQAQTGAYHYRNDPVPPKPVVIENISSDDTIHSWRFEMPRKRGKPVTGTFSFIGDDKNIRQAFIDFTGKSRREVLLKHYAKENAVFSLDTWMGPVEFRMNFNANKIHGNAIVGNTPYTISGEKISANFSLQNEKKTTAVYAQKQLPKTESVAHLSAEQEALILGGEAALWAEIADEQSIDLRLWPRAFIVAERLWSARDLQDENSMYVRVNSVESWAEKSIGLLHRQQQLTALQKLAGKSEIAPVKVFADMLEPAHYYHRQHEKSAYETYSKADPLNRLVDALPAENEYLRQFNQRLDKWLKNPQENADYYALRAELEQWAANRVQLQPLLQLHPEWTSLANKVDLVARTCLDLLDARVKTTVLMQSERKKVMELIQQAQKLDQELVVAVATSLEKILNSFTQS